jgi:excisionase family DNA binding protein
MMVAIEKYLSPEEIAEKLGIVPATVREWLRKGELKGLKLGRLWRVKESDLQAFLESKGITSEKTESSDAPG